MSSQLDYLREASRLIEIIEENEANLNKEDYLFLLSMKNRVELGGEISQKQIFWLRDIKDRQL